jgi:hypothetical protein
MTRNRSVFGALILLLLVPALLTAQGTTGQLTGTVTQTGSPLPGVTVTVSSPTMQGTRTTVSNDAGTYNFGALPPGDFTVVFTLEGMQSSTKKTNVALASTSRVDVDLKMSSVAEAITVTASAPTVMETTQVESNLKQSDVNKLPVNRNPVAVANLTPGVTTTGPGGNTVISGAFSYDNLWLVNGAVVNENLRGQPHALYIEDAIQETTILSGGVSAEYGRFTGGVVSSITKSGGNEFSGSFRDTLQNDNWTAKSTPTQSEPLDQINPTYEATLGGRILRDRLWFFAAGRQADDAVTRPFTKISASSTLNTPSWDQANTRHRLEGKLTGQITSRHSLVVSYLNNNTTQTNNCQFGCIDANTLDPDVSNPNNFKTAHYNGIITNAFMVEADYAKKYFAFVGYGGTQAYGVANKTAAELAAGSPIGDAVVTGAYFNAPYFCGTCGSELRNDNEWSLKGRYFLGTRTMGTHNAVLGYEDWAEQRKSNNFQSPTDFRFDILNVAPVQNADGTMSVTIKGSPTTGDRFVYFPIQYQSLGSDLVTKSIFVNDKWDLNPHFSFNVGARYDKNNAIDSLHSVVSKDSAISPRIGVIYDVMGNGRFRFDANYGEYVGRLAETVAGLGSAAGNPASIVFRYSGPDIPLMDARAALTQAFDWLLANGFTNRAPTGNPSIPGFNRKLEGPIKSPNMKEVTVGAGTQIGKGYLRADVIHRDWDNFYVNNVNLAIGQVTNPANAALKADLQLVGNSDVPDRKYDGVQLQGQYSLTNNFSAGANYTWSTLKGNVEGETSGGGPVAFTGGSIQYPEYQNFAQNAPTGYLNADQRHKVRAWVNYGLGTPIGRFNLGLLQRFDSGQAYSASAAMPIQFSPNFYRVGTDPSTCPSSGCAGGIVNPGYAGAPTTVTYFFSKRGEFRVEDLMATDLALNYELPIKMLGLFAKAEVRNVFNRLGVVDPVRTNTTVYTAANAGRGLRAFNPFTDTPVECPQGSAAATCTAMGANWMKDANFGKATGTATTFGAQGSYQLPRTYVVSLGARF